MLCIGPKGENARAHDAKDKVWCLNLFGVSGQPLSANPLDRLNPASLDLLEDANTLADTLAHDGVTRSHT